MNPDGNLGICWELVLLIPSSLSAAGRMSAELVLMENRSKHSLIASSASPRPLCTEQLLPLSHLVGNSSGTLQGSDDFPDFFFPVFLFPLLLAQLFLPLSLSPHPAWWIWLSVWSLWVKGLLGNSSPSSLNSWDRASWKMGFYCWKMGSAAEQDGGDVSFWGR